MNINQLYQFNNLDKQIWYELFVNIFLGSACFVLYCVFFFFRLVLKLESLYWISELNTDCSLHDSFEVGLHQLFFDIRS